MKLLNSIDISFIAIVIYILILPIAKAGFWVGPFEFAITSETGRYVFTMAPREAKQKPSKEVYKSNGVGRCFFVSKDGTLKLHWSVEGWYSKNLFLSNNGNTLVRLGSWESGDQNVGPVEEWLALQFYYKGALKKSYIIRDLIDDTKNLVPTTAGHIWVKDGGFGVDGNSFFVKTIEGEVFNFSIFDGELIKK